MAPRLSGSPTDFAAQVAASVRGMKAKAELFQRRVGEQVAERLIQNTPYDTGLLRNSFRARKGNAGGAYETTPDISGGASIAQIRTVLATIKLGETVVILNTAPYAIYVERGTSRMRPRPFLRTTLAQVPGIIKQVAAQVRGMR